jgi:hypothetical protein
MFQAALLHTANNVLQTIVIVKNFSILGASAKAAQYFALQMPGLKPIGIHCLIPL